jgi:hypothetical protein
VALLTPITTGVGECIDGVLVGGKNGVGGLYGDGWKNQPLHDVSRNIARNVTVILFISSPPNDSIPLETNQQSPNRHSPRTLIRWIQSFHREVRGDLKAPRFP